MTIYFAQKVLEHVAEKSENNRNVNNWIGVFHWKTIILVEVIDKTLWKCVVVPVFGTVMPSDCFVHVAE